MVDYRLALQSENHTINQDSREACLNSMSRCKRTDVAIGLPLIPGELRDKTNRTQMPDPLLTNEAITMSFIHYNHNHHKCLHKISCKPFIVITFILCGKAAKRFSVNG